MRINAGIYIEDNISYTTKNFKKHLYLGCPINAVMHFSKFEYDEILLLNNSYFLNSFDILNFKKISESSLKPKCYGGGIRTLSQAKTIIEVGYERVSLRKLYFKDINEYRSIMKLLGRQSITLCLDIKKIDNVYCIISDDILHIKLSDFNIDLEDIPGEIFINNVDTNGCLGSFDLELINMIKNRNWPTNINYCGGISSMSEINILEQNNFTAVTVFTRAATINNGNDKLLNNTIFYE
jgi:cyclase